MKRRCVSHNDAFASALVESIAVSVLCFQRATPWRGIECVNYDPSWRDRRYVLSEKPDSGRG